jgi:hypothetical protein
VLQQLRRQLGIKFEVDVLVAKSAVRVVLGGGDVWSKVVKNGLGDACGDGGFDDLNREDFDGWLDSRLLSRLDDWLDSRLLSRLVMAVFGGKMAGGGCLVVAGFVDKKAGSVGKKAGWRWQEDWLAVAVWLAVIRASWLASSLRARDDWLTVDGFRASWLSSCLRGD